MAVITARSGFTDMVAGLSSPMLMEFLLSLSPPLSILSLFRFFRETLHSSITKSFFLIAVSFTWLSLHALSPTYEPKIIITYVNHNSCA